jgi:hypothetical protein
MGPSTFAITAISPSSINFTMLFWSFDFLITLQRYEFYVTPHFKTALNFTLSTLNKNEIPRLTARNDSDRKKME